MSSNLSSNPYTNAPPLSNNLILGSFQLLYWLFFKPSAWRNYIQRTDSNLPFDFCLSDLTWQKWLKSGLWRVFVQGYIILPFLSILIIWIWLWIQEPSINNVSTEFIVAGSLGFSLACSLAFGVISSTVVGIASSVPFAIAGSVTLFQQELNYLSVGIWCLMFGIAGNVIITLSTEHDSLTNHIGKIFLGIFIGSIGTFVLIAIPLGIIDTTGVNIAIATLTLISVMIIILANFATDCKFNNWSYPVIGFFVVFYGAFAFHSEGMVGGLATGLVYGTMISACLAIPYTITYRVLSKGAIAAGAVSGALFVSAIWGFLAGIFISEKISFSSILPFIIIGLVAAIFGLSFAKWRTLLFFPFLLAWHTAIYYFDKQRLLDKKPSLLRYHAAFWDEHQWIKLWGLQDHILLVMEKKPTEGTKALDYLKNGHQQWVIHEVQVAIDIRALEKFKNIHAIGDAYKNLKTVTREGDRFIQISRDVNNALKQQTLQNQILYFHEVCNLLNNLIFREFRGENISHATRRFIPLAEVWYQIISDQQSLLQTQREERKQIESPYIFGMPLKIGQQSFVGRTDIVDELQNLLFEQSTSVFLHGQYRIGKTSLLMNLRSLLGEPHMIVALLVDLQGAVAISQNVAGFFHQVAEQMKKSAKEHYDLSFSSLSLEELNGNPYDRFNKWLDKVQEVLETKTLLLMFDEFAKLDEVLLEQKYDYSQDILDVMRHWIQHRSRFQIVITSQRLEEFRRWPSLANTMVPKHLTYLTESEARQLIEHPVKGFPLHYESAATQRILELTRCHPALVQLLCREIVVLKNQQNLESRFLVGLPEVEAVVPKALETGMSIFVTFEQKATDAGNTLLRYMATWGEKALINQEQLVPHCPTELEIVLKLLQQLELIEEVAGAYRFQIELFRRWYAKPF